MEDFKIALVSTKEDSNRKIVTEIIYDIDTVIEKDFMKPYVEIITTNDWKVIGTRKDYPLKDEGFSRDGVYLTEEEFQTIKEFIENRLSHVIEKVPS